LIIVFMTFGGFFLIHPNESKVFTFLGKYIGSARAAGFYWANPFAVKKKVTLRIFNFNSETLKVNDALGNPIEIAAVVVWHVVDSAKALFNVESYQNFVAIQSETAIRQLATHYPYDAHDKDTESLRANPDEIAGKLKGQVQNRLDVAGLHVVEARLSHLAYAPEIAQAMLRRQQAEAIIAARRQIVDGAVGMVEMALKSLEAQGVVTLDEERKAAMVNNLLVALVSESEMHPIVNTGTLHT
jgi:regulator of protease activity HflC (stomatin/prohibitin superfamily)